MTHGILDRSATAALGFLLAGCLQADALPEREEALARALLQPAEEMARPCLANTRRCLDLAEAPFTVCGLRSNRCPQDARYENLRLRHTQER